MAALSLLPALSGATDVDNQTIETYGIGRANPAMTNDTQRRAAACDAAIVDAQARMLVILQGLRQNGTPSQHGVMQSGVLQGAKIVKTEWIDPGQCRVTLRLSEARYEKLTGEQLSNGGDTAER